MTMRDNSAMHIQPTRNSNKFILKNNVSEKVGGGCGGCGGRSLKKKMK